MLGLSTLITAKKFENEASFLRYTLIGHDYGACRKRSSNRKNLKTLTAIFLRLDLPCTLILSIRQDNGACQKHPFKEY